MNNRVMVFGLMVLALVGIGAWLIQGGPGRDGTEVVEARGGAERLGPQGSGSTVLQRAHAELRDRQGQAVGNANLTATERGVRIEVEVAGLTPGRHGFHIHEVGRCEGPDFTSAGGHFNPVGTHHGIENPRGPHGGDLPNLMAGEDGRATLTTVNPYLSLGTGAEDDLLRTGGTAIMIHAGPDDYQTDPAGDSGARVVCGVIERVP